MKKNTKNIVAYLQKDQADKTQSAKQMKPWETECHAGDLSNVVTDHLLKTCPKKVLNKLLGQIKENWDHVIGEEHVFQYMYGAEIAEPFTVENCLDHALDCLMWQTVLELLNRHDIHESFDLMTMKVKDADLLDLTKSKEAILGIALNLKGDKTSITIYPRIGPHFACSWFRGPFEFHMPKMKMKKKK